VSFLGLLMLLGSALGVVAALLHSHRQAQAAADLAALAGAQAASRAEDACAVAAAVAADNGGRLGTCTVADREVRVSVEVEGPDWLAPPAVLVGHARAGPA